MQPKTIGERVANLRKKRSLTQAELARLVYVSPQEVCRWETGQRHVPSEQIGKIAIVLNTSCDYLILGKKNC